VEKKYANIAGFIISKFTILSHGTINRWRNEMPLITDKIKANADKCKQCAFLKIRNMKLEHSSVLYDEAVITVEGIYRTSCAMCPFEKDFEKVYGMKPYEYFPMVNAPVKDKAE
jgi:hypothetical protein